MDFYIWYNNLKTNKRDWDMGSCQNMPLIHLNAKSIVCAVLQKKHCSISVLECLGMYFFNKKETTPPEFFPPCASKEPA